MNLPVFLTLPFWNQLARTHFSEIIVVLTAAVVVILERHFRKIINNFTKSYGRIIRFIIFLVVCSVGYSALALGVAWALREGLTLAKGVYMAPTVLGILIIVAISAERQKQI